MASAIGAALLSTALQAVGNIAVSEYTNNRTDRAVERQNEYNLPVNQVERMKAAGLNPAALSMQNGMSIGGNTSASPNAYVNPSVPDLLGGASGSLLNLTNSEDINSTREARIKLATQQAEQAKQNALNLGASTSAQLELNKWIGLQQSYAARESQSRIDMAYWQVNEIKTAISTIRQKLPLELGELASKINLNNLSLDHILAQIADLKASASLKGEQAETEQAKQEQMSVETGLKEQESDYYSKITDKVIDLYSSQIKEAQARTGLTEEETYWKAFEWLDRSIQHAQDPVIGIGSGRANQQIRDAARDRIGLK